MSAIKLFDWLLTIIESNARYIFRLYTILFGAQLGMFFVVLFIYPGLRDLAIYTNNLLMILLAFLMFVTAILFTLLIFLFKKEYGHFPELFR